MSNELTYWVPCKQTVTWLTWAGQVVWPAQPVTAGTTRYASPQSWGTPSHTCCCGQILTTDLSPIAEALWLGLGMYSGIHGDKWELINPPKCNSIVRAMDATHLKIRHQKMKSMGPQSSNVLQWLYLINSLCPSDTIWRQRSGSTLAQVMACCLAAPSHYLNKCWLIIS